MKLRTIARLVLFVRPDKEWLEIKTYELNQPVVRIGRTKECEIKVYFSNFAELCRAVSRFHATLFYYSGENPDYFIRDGLPAEVNKFNQNPESIISGLGIYINSHPNRLEPDIKYCLNDRDEFYLVPNRLKFVYLRENKTVSEQLLEDTFIPPEYLT